MAVIVLPVKYSTLPLKTHHLLYPDTNTFMTRVIHALC